jgi:hypothetical protein
METIVIITKTPVVDDFKKELGKTKLRVENNPAGGVTISNKNTSHIYIEGPASDAYEFYKAENELDKVLEKIENPIFYYCYYRDIDLMKEISLLLFDKREMLIDNDFGLIMPGNEWVEMIKSRPGWDWREHV